MNELTKEIEKEQLKKQNVEVQKNGYKNKLRLANQRLKNMSNSIEDIAIVIYQKLVNAEISKNEIDRMETIENEISTLTQMIRLKEEELSHDITFA